MDQDDAESAKSAGKNGPANPATSRVVTLQMLLAADILQPGDGYMSIEYLVRFKNNKLIVIWYAHYLFRKILLAKQNNKIVDNS